jgi:hypothetical protein
MDWGIIITGSLIPAASIFFVWFTQKYLPARDKRIEADTMRRFGQTQGTQSFNEKHLDQLIKHTIDSNNGHLAALTAEVTQGNKDLLDQSGKIIAGFNLLIVLLSKNQATNPLVKDRKGTSKVMEATIETDAEKDIQKISDEAAEDEAAEDETLGPRYPG